MKKDWRHPKAMINCLKQFASTQLLLLHLIISLLFFVVVACYCANCELQINGTSTRKKNGIVVAFTWFPSATDALPSRRSTKKKFQVNAINFFNIQFFLFLFFAVCTIIFHYTFLFNKCLYIFFYIFNSQSSLKCLLKNIYMKFIEMFH